MLKSLDRRVQCISEVEDSGASESESQIDTVMVGVVVGVGGRIVVLGGTKTEKNQKTKPQNPKVVFWQIERFLWVARHAAQWRHLGESVGYLTSVERV